MLHRFYASLCVVLSGALLFAGTPSTATAAMHIPSAKAPTAKSAATVQEAAIGDYSLPGISELPSTGGSAGSGVQLLAQYGTDVLTSGWTNLAAGSDLVIPTTFNITRPDEKLTTTYANYFITGTSDPNSPVYFGGTEIERLGTKGTFGVHVNLAIGSNSFTFSQGGETQTVVIERKAATTAEAPISEIAQSSMIPAHMTGTKVGGTISVGCTAPAGATVRATFDGTTVTLTQEKPELSAGQPATFTGKITIGGSYDPDITQAAGKVTYEMSYQGATKTYTSNGQVYVAGSNSAVAVEVTSYMGFVYPDLKNLANFKEKVKAGARDYIKNQDNAYFELSSGGYISKEMVKVVEGEVSVGNRLGDVSTNVGTRSESYTFSGTNQPFYSTKITDNTFHLTMYNTSGSPGMDVSSSRVVSSASVEQGTDSVTYKMPLKGTVWGYDVSFDGSNTKLMLKYKPTTLEGMTILLDPGHGGTDPGALGLAGKTGPTEADVNLANALVTRSLLTSMGANVVMTRETNSYVSLDDRLKAIEESGADLFVSMHHNSLGENVDANKVSGMEIYYHTGLSKTFADRMMNGLSTGLNRNNRSVNQSYYRVTLSPYSPALLLELGFMSNPVEYEKATTSAEMDKVAAAVADGIKRSIQ